MCSNQERHNHDRPFARRCPADYHVRSFLFRKQDSLLNVDSFLRSALLLPLVIHRCQNTKECTDNRDLPRGTAQTADCSKPVLVSRQGSAEQRTASERAECKRNFRGINGSHVEKTACRTRKWFGEKHNNEHTKMKRPNDTLQRGEKNPLQGFSSQDVIPIDTMLAFCCYVITGVRHELA